MEDSTGKPQTSLICRDKIKSHVFYLFVHTVQQQSSNSNYDNAGGQCYDDLFPALPESAPPKYNNMAPNSNQVVRQRVVTQVFYVPSGERKYDSEKFGEGESKVRRSSAILQYSF
jgi:hypothetical protein